MDNKYEVKYFNPNNLESIVIIKNEDSETYGELVYGKVTEFAKE